MEITNHLPSGWLVEPTGKEMILFIKAPISIKTFPILYIDKWSAINGIRNKFQERKILMKDDALKLWNNLLAEGWSNDKYVYNKIA